MRSVDVYTVYWCAVDWTQSLLSPDLMTWLAALPQGPKTAQGVICIHCVFFFFSSRRRHTRCSRDWSSDVCSSDLGLDGSPQSFHGLKIGLALSRALNRPLQAIAVYDPYLHYAMFNGIVGVLNEKEIGRASCRERV